MKTFGGILKELNSEQLINYIKSHTMYGVMGENIEYILEQMSSLESVAADGQLILKRNGLEEDTWDVVVERDGKVYAIDWTPWEEAKGFLIDVEEIKKEVSIEEFVSMILYDLTFDGEDYQVQKKKISELISRIDG
ncbi:DUF6557 family protein [Planomicrobium sp. Y74]|uniref:DUF6557 family protein n=1 Tax=Planomicrobium sp. Y74 TaxID=2478977 RepID=UPI000EF4932C|nr:DUF6557 family protein [Planomicrobium sp. Y74]RLQ91952.1 hypothetical protein D9754_03970 [Planomicrobium sp. Y74]